MIFKRICFGLSVLFLLAVSVNYLIRKSVRKAFQQKKMERVFTEIFHEKKWGEEGTISGPGSNLVQTETIRTEIPKLLEELKIKVLIDAPCGDYFWMKKMDLQLEKYIGVDIVKELIEKNQKLYGDLNHLFYSVDLCKEKLPKGELILCRDCWVHLSYNNIAQCLNLFKQSGAEYLLTTTFIDRESNFDIETGCWRPINLQRAPFNFPKPIAIIHENCTQDKGNYKDKCLALWPLKSLEMALEKD